MMVFEPNVFLNKIVLLLSAWTGIPHGLKSPNKDTELQVGLDMAVSIISTTTWLVLNSDSDN
jgi:hypothetical protein